MKEELVSKKVYTMLLYTERTNGTKCIVPVSYKSLENQQKKTKIGR